MKTISKCIFLLVCVSIVVIAQRDPVDFSTLRFGFGSLNIHNWMSKFCNHFCEHPASKTTRTFSLCSVKCSTSTTTEKSPTTDAKDRVETTLASITTTPRSTTSPTNSSKSSLRESNGDGARSWRN
ncbi:uncharacterized protein LOC107044417 [Diachasma alloeum]|uniref:uncharacterized protein LOC107044417 n=1 Tax=Diachasma alloeum TaxID=454923 RepID=UPI0007384D58|nr:uncharacterized protein LOC107044417 [Diachasma alloeum]